MKLMLRHAWGGGWGGVGWDVNVHVNLRHEVDATSRMGWEMLWMPVWLKANGITGLATRTPGRHRERSSKPSETCSCCEETEKLVSHVSGDEDDDDDDDDDDGDDDDDDYIL